MLYAMPAETEVGNGQKDGRLRSNAMYMKGMILSVVDLEDKKKLGIRKKEAT